MTKFKRTFGMSLLIGIFALIMSVLVVPTANAAAPAKPATCSASKVPWSTGAYAINWSKVTANPAVNWYNIRVKGDPASSIKVEDPDATSAMYTKVFNTSYTPLTFMVRAHNPDGVGPWCETTLSPYDGGGGTTNTPPSVDAGPDLNVVRPNAANLDGTTSDADGDNVTEQWSKVSGPGTVTFTCSQCQNATATFSQAGTYVLRLTGNDGTVSVSDDVTVTVTDQSAPTNAAPSVNAGTDKNVTLPNSASLDGTVSDDGLPSGSTVTSTWSKVSGPSTVTFGNASNVDTTASFGAAGTYVLRLTATDGALSASDDVTVTVSSAPVSNTVPGPPEPCAATPVTGGYKITWTRPNSSNVVFRYAIRAKGQVDPTVTLASENQQTEASQREYTWTGTTAGASSPLTFLVRGINSVGVGEWCEAPVGGGGGEPPANAAPSVNAGADASITLPASANLNGTVSDDGLPTGSTVSTTWTKVSGVGTVTFGNASNVDTTASFSAEGTYVLRLTATDGSLSNSDEVTITVSEEVVNPGPSGPNAEHLGVRVFPHYEAMTYGHHDAVLDVLGDLGTKRISGLLTPNISPDEISFYQQAYQQYGIKVWFAVGTPHTTLSDSQWGTISDLLSGPLKNMVVAASGWNEPNNSGGTGWSTPTAAHQAKLWSTIQNVNAATGQNILVGTPPLHSGCVPCQEDDARELAPKIAGKYNLINWHLYPHGKSGTELFNFLKNQKTVFQGIYGSQWPILNSESGYFTAPNYTGGSNPSTYQSQEIELPQLAQYHLDLGIDLSYFELLDDPDPESDDREANFGIVEVGATSTAPSYWFYKPAFDDYANMMSQG